MTCFVQVHSYIHKPNTQGSSSQTSTASTIPASFALSSLFEAASSAAIGSLHTNLILTLSPPRLTNRPSPPAPRLHPTDHIFNRYPPAIHSPKRTSAPTPQHHTRIPSRPLERQTIPHSKHNHRNRRKSRDRQPLAMGCTRTRDMDPQPSSRRRHILHRLGHRPLLGSGAATSQLLATMRARPPNPTRTPASQRQENATA